MADRAIPVFGTDYDIGCVFFTMTEKNILSCGIRWFSRDDVPLDFVPSHCGVVTGANECYEALAQGVVKSDLQKYFSNPKVRIVFRFPHMWTPEMGLRIKASAEKLAFSPSGKPVPYGYGLIVGHAAAQSLVGRVLNVLTFGWSTKLILSVANRKNSLICNEYLCDVLKAQPELVNHGCLQLPSYETRPLMLCTDGFLWKQP